MSNVSNNTAAIRPRMSLSYFDIISLTAQEDGQSVVEVNVLLVTSHHVEEDGEVGEEVEDVDDVHVTSASCSV